MIRNALIVLGIGGIGYALYNYFNKQLQLALDWDFKIKDLKVLRFDAYGIELDLLVSVLNKSSFKVEVKDYDIDVLYRNVKIGNAKNSIPFTVEGESWFDVPTRAYVQFKGTTGILDDLGMALLKNEPITFDVRGDMNVVFGSIAKKVKFNVKDVVVSKNISTDLGIAKPVTKVTDFLGNLGIKI